MKKYMTSHDKHEHVYTLSGKLENYYPFYIIGFEENW